MAPRLCDRNFGVGADGVILAIPLNMAACDLLRAPLKQAVVKPQKRGSGDYPVRHERDEPERYQQPQALADFEKGLNDLVCNYPDVDQCDLAWFYTNSDGSQSDMCGNGLRCLALFARENLPDIGSSLKIATARGPVAVNIDNEYIEVDLGEPVLVPGLIPAKVEGILPDLAPDQPIISSLLSIEGEELAVTVIGMGNPHCVIFCKTLFPKEKDQLQGYFPEHLKKTALAIQSHPLFPESVNVEFVKVLKEDLVETLVYERGCGPTLACASGAAAVVVAGILTNCLAREVTVRLPGGELLVSWSEDDRRVAIKGRAAEVFSGVIRLDLEGPVANGSQSAREVRLS